MVLPLKMQEALKEVVLLVFSLKKRNRGVTALRFIGDCQVAIGVDVLI